MRTYDEMVNEAAETGIAHVRALAREGITNTVRVYYKKGALALASDSATFPMSAEWTDSGLVVPATLPYAGYATWLRNNAMRLPLF